LIRGKGNSDKGKGAKVELGIKVGEESSPFMGRGNFSEDRRKRLAKGRGVEGELGDLP